MHEVSSEDVVSWVRAAIVELTGTDIKDSTLIASLDVTGTDVETVLMRAEEHFDIEFPHMNASNFYAGRFTTVGDIIAFIRHSLRREAA